MHVFCDMNVEKKLPWGIKETRVTGRGKGDCSQCLKVMISELDHYLLLSGYRSQSKDGQKEYVVQTTEQCSLLSLEA